jgi:hypothetical protein
LKVKDTENKDYEDDDCLTLLQRYTNYFITNGDHILSMMRNSGKDINDFGRFQECEQSPEFNYLLAYIDPAKQLPIPVSVGLCLPTVCGESDLNELKPYILPAINKELPELVSEIEGFDLSNLSLEDSDIHITNSLKLNNQCTSFSFENFLFIALMLGLVVFSVFASIIAHQRYKARKQKMLEKKQAKANPIIDANTAVAPAPQ